MTRFGIVTHMGRGMFLGGLPRHCICTNVSHILSAIAKFLACRLLETENQFLIKVLVLQTLYRLGSITWTPCYVGLNVIDGVQNT